MEKYQAPTGLNVPAMTGQGGVYVGVLGGLNNVSAYRNLFDLYRIEAMEVTFLPGASMADPSGAGGNLPMLYIAPNRNTSVGAPISVADILNDDQVQVVRLDKVHTFKLSYPKPQLQDRTGTLFDWQLQPGKAGQPWLSTGGNGGVDQTAIEHFGFRWYLDNSPNPFVWSNNVIITLHFSMKEQD